MAVAEMRKVIFVGEKEVEERFIKKLSEVGIFQPVPVDKKTLKFLKVPEVKTDSLQNALNKIESAINFLTQFEEKKFDLGLFPSKLIVHPEKWSKWIKDFKWERVCRMCEEIEKDTEKIKEELSSLKEEYTNLLPWRKMTFPLTILKASKYLDCQAGIVPAESKNLILKLTQKKPIHALILEEVGRKIYLLLIFTREKKEEVEKILQKAKGEKVKLKEDIAPSERIENIKKRYKELEERKKEILNQAKNLVQEKPKLMVFYDYFYDQLKEKKARSSSGISRYTFFLEGWIKKDDIVTLKKIMKEFPRVEAVVRKPDKRESSKIPVALSNSGLFKPFELVTELYGLPRYIEIDPTPFLAPFFALFLALCLTDGGYGILLVIFSFLIPRKIQVGEGGKKLFSMLFISGLVTILVGTLTGGIFGIQIQNLPSFFDPLKKLSLFNPMQQPMIFLVIALIIGVIHLLAGISLEMIDNLRRKNITGAFLDQVTWILIIIGLLLVAAPFGKGFISQETSSQSSGGITLTLSPSQFLLLLKQMPWYSRAGFIFFLFGGITLFLFAGRKSKNIGKRLAKGAYEVYGIIQIFADILSYSRLLALGLATSVIATVVNTIASMSGGIPLLGPVAAVLILVLGHIGNLLINALSGFIHTARLQFVEFFTKFYEGGGRKFEPLRREGKYTIIREFQGGV
ncbi:V-type ATP synthase subunit I [Candidatus Aerophobetes bacterium]|nr:V-type ATP synthase subunit I [Candidatus Aerophobetes bacterium]